MPFSKPQTAHPPRPCSGNSSRGYVITRVSGGSGPFGVRERETFYADTYAAEAGGVRFTDRDTGAETFITGGAITVRESR